jgi:hypothetical protein
MNTEIQEFIAKARERNVSDDDIRVRLSDAGWEQVVIAAALSTDGLTVPLPPQRVAATPIIDTKRKSQTILLSDDERRIKSVVFEYHIMFITLWLVVIAAFWAINGALAGSEFSSIKFPVTAVIVCLPILGVLFSRRVKQERREPEIRRVNDRVQLIHATQSLAFLFLVIHTIYLVYQLISASDSLAQQAFSWVCSFILFGGIFVYYWNDSKRSLKPADR